MLRRISFPVLIVSDATGRTAEAVIRAVLVQFPEVRPELTIFANVRTKDRLMEVLRRAEASGGILVYSIVIDELRRLIRKEGRRRNLILFDLLGPLMARLRRLFNLVPILTPGLVDPVHRESLRMAEAIDFTLKHDDGLGMESIGQADLVILGVSRTSKTPTSIYLACNHGLKVANVPILADRELPLQIMQSPQPKVGFTIDPERLMILRRARMKELPLYADPRHVYREVDHSERIFRRIRNLSVIDVTDLSIEEISSRIIERLGAAG